MDFSPYKARKSLLALGCTRIFLSQLHTGDIWKMPVEKQAKAALLLRDTAFPASWNALFGLRCYATVTVATLDVIDAAVALPMTQ